MLRYFTAFLFILALSSCAPIGRAVSQALPKEEEEPIENGGIPDALLPGGRGEVTITPAESRTVGAGQDPAKVSGILGLPAQEDILFLDPDNYEESEEALSGLVGIQKKDWLASHSIARNFSMVDGKPLLIFFTDSPSSTHTGSVTAVGLERELFARTDFSDWASERVVRLKLDYGVKVKDLDADKQNEALRKKKFLESLKKRYKVSGLPVVLVLAPDGTEVQRIRGYLPGNYEHTWGLLRTAEVAAQERHESFESTLKKKGYRRWTGKNDRRILARLASYKDGKILLIGPNGKRHQTTEANLSREDRKWIAEAKEKSATPRVSR